MTTATLQAAPEVTGLENLPPYLRVREVAALTSLSTSTIWRAVWSGDLQSTRFAGKARRISRSQLIVWLRSKESADVPTPAPTDRTEEDSNDVSCIARASSTE